MTRKVREIEENKPRADPCPGVHHFAISCTYIKAYDTDRWPVYHKCFFPDGYRSTRWCKHRTRSLDVNNRSTELTWSPADMPVQIPGQAIARTGDVRGGVARFRTKQGKTCRMVDNKRMGAKSTNRSDPRRYPFLWMLNSVRLDLERCRESWLLCLPFFFFFFNNYLNVCSTQWINDVPLSRAATYNDKVDFGSGNPSKSMEGGLWVRVIFAAREHTVNQWTGTK